MKTRLSFTLSPKSGFRKLDATALTGFAGAVVAGAAGQRGRPEAGVGWLFTGAEEEQAVGGEQAVDVGEKLLARLLGEVEHDVTQEDDIEGLGKGEPVCAEVGNAEVAELAQVGLDHPVLSVVIEEADDVAGREAAVHFDAVIAGGLAAVDDFGADIRALDFDIPGGELGKVLAEQHGDAVSLMAGGTGGAPNAKAAGDAPAFKQGGQQFGAQQLEGAAITKEAGFVDSHGLGDGALQGLIVLEAKQLDEFFDLGEALVAQKPGEAGLEQVVAGGIEDILRLFEDQLTQVGVVNVAGSGTGVGRPRSEIEGAGNCGWVG